MERAFLAKRLLNIHPDVWFTNGGFKGKYRCSIVGLARSLVGPCLDGASAAVFNVVLGRNLGVADSRRATPALIICPEALGPDSGSEAS